MTVHIVLGPPCAGKSTWVASRRNTDEPVVDYDKLTQALGASHSHEAPEPIRQCAWAARRAAIAKAYELESDSWVIHAFASQDMVDSWAENGCVFHMIDPGIQACIERALADGRPEGTIQKIEDWYRNVPALPEGSEVISTVQGEKAVNEIKTKSFEIKAANEEEGVAGIFTGYASVFGNVDSYGDVVARGAFTKSLATYGKDGAGIPCYWGHKMDDPMMNIGQTISAVEDDHGLLVKVQLDLENPNAAYVHRLIKQGRVSMMSFAYEINEAAWVETLEEQFYELRDLSIFEVSVVPIGANTSTEITSVKADQPTTCASCAHERKSDLAADKEPEPINAEEPTHEVNAEETTQAKKCKPETALATIALASM